MIPVPIITNVQMFATGHAQVEYPSEPFISMSKRRIAFDYHLVQYRMVDNDPARLEPVE